jgi:hypothetical protein
MIDEEALNKSLLFFLLCHPPAQFPWVEERLVPASRRIRSWAAVEARGKDVPPPSPNYTIEIHGVASSTVFSAIAVAGFSRTKDPTRPRTHRVSRGSTQRRASRGNNSDFLPPTRMLAIEVAAELNSDAVQRLAEISAVCYDAQVVYDEVRPAFYRPQTSH